MADKSWTLTLRVKYSTLEFKPTEQQRKDQYPRFTVRLIEFNMFMGYIGISSEHDQYNFNVAKDVTLSVGMMVELTGFLTELNQKFMDITMGERRKLLYEMGHVITVREEKLRQAKGEPKKGTKISDREIKIIQ